MTQLIDIPKAETGVVRLFAVSLPDEEAKALKETSAVEVPKLLGLASLDMAQVELFPITDLGEMTLPEYLNEGHGIAEGRLAADRPKLAALEGWVLIIRSASLPEDTQQVQLDPVLTLIGTYAEPRTDWTEGAPLTSASATAPAKPTRKPVSNAAMSGRVATFALLFIFAFTAAIVWIAS